MLRRNGRQRHVLVFYLIPSLLAAAAQLFSYSLAYFLVFFPSSSFFFKSIDGTLSDVVVVVVLLCWA